MSNPYHLPHLKAQDDSSDFDPVKAYHLPRHHIVSTSTTTSTTTNVTTTDVANGKPNGKPNGQAKSSKKERQPERRSSILQRVRQVFRPDSLFKRGNTTNGVH